MFLTPQILQVAGAILVAAALLQVALLFVSSLRRASFENERRRESLEFLSPPRAGGPGPQQRRARSGRALVEIEVEFVRAGKTLKWDTAAESLLDFAEENGIVIDSGCRAGNCDTCITAIKAGEVTYINEPGEPPEAGSCLTCIAVPKANLTLDA